ncbi:MAG: Holliday junction resolvase RecU [Erysipelothrix sp.]|nr:Holliday junction resolvase RecU [Erysipelothrix sp.]
MIQYPSGKKSNNRNSKTLSSAKRGMALEDDINISNAYYNSNLIAVIHKKPTPIQVVRVDYSALKHARISEAYYTQASTTDYNGVYEGYAVDFEAKETKNKTSFPLASIHKHQLDHMQSVLKHKAITFLIIRFSYHNETYLVYAEDLFNFIENTDRKSIPFDWIKQEGHLIPYRYQIPCDYISILNEKRDKEKL